jgi:hypothetical protein
MNSLARLYVEYVPKTTLAKRAATGSATRFTDVHANLTATLPPAGGRISTVTMAS